MRGQLTKNGDFVVERKDKFTNLCCPFQQETTNCGTWCPHFSEPIKQRNTPNNRSTSREETLVHICHGRYWKFTEFEDARCKP